MEINIGDIDPNKNMSKDILGGSKFLLVFIDSQGKGGGVQKKPLMVSSSHDGISVPKWNSTLEALTQTRTCQKTSWVGQSFHWFSLTPKERRGPEKGPHGFFKS